MKFAVSTDGEGGPDAVVATDFGRGDTFTIVEAEGTEIRSVRVVDNDGRRIAQGAGIAAADQVILEGVDAVVAGHFGPHAEEIFGEEGIVIVYMPRVTVREAVERYHTAVQGT
ncbi:NifB/NifX family molybdenum-iron cluster-binding protein [Methanofollis fontis]|uniref:Dinitrogenase iron-molybdenum cofactor n=1 Tax=Methanofollis fontis TaxID=2052832 RepID=A0A483CMR2_9EURY|nr:NifB/NifX family molybdenum-iron cluster-binding protein [Methanofollis fontis]TAJ44259.1 dinitrogenase iron-molybdenum cofactor [Methanofollis fontis]